MKKIISATLILFLLSDNAYALNLSRTKTWSSGEVLTEKDLNAEFDNILNHSIKNADIDAAAAIVASKIDFTTASAIGSTTASTGAFTTLNASGATTLDGNVDIGDAPADTVHFNTNTITFEGATANDFEVTFAIPDVGSDKTIAFQDIAGTVAVTGGTDIVVADGGTGVSTFTDGGPLLGSGTGAITAMAVLADSEMIVGDGTTDPVVESGATLRTSIGVAIGTDVQAYDAQLADLADGELGGAATVNTSALTGTTYLPNATVDTTALKTSTVEVSRTETGFPEVRLGDNFSGGSFLTNVWISTSSGSANYTLTGSEDYGFYPRIRQNGTDAFVTQRYVTASGQDYWIFLEVDKITGERISAWAAPDHPSYGDNIEEIPHPFLDCDHTKCDIILLDKTTTEAIRQEAKDTGKSVLTVVNENYKPDTIDKVYEPLHSGKFLGKVPVMIESIPDYIKIRGLKKLSQGELSQRNADREQAKQKAEADKVTERTDKSMAFNKLLALGLTNDEIKALLK